MTGVDRARRVHDWTRPSIRSLKPYYKAPLEGDPLRLDQNTNLYGANPATRALHPELPPVDQYPSRDADELMAALGERHGLPAERFIVGNGSDELLDIVTKAFTAPGQTMAVPAPSYSLYPFYATLQGLDLARVPMATGWQLDVDAMLATDAALTIIATPNNPTGNRVPTAELERLLAGTDGVVVVDEAYIEYAGEEHSLLQRIEEFDNLIVMRTLSKAHGLAGLRVGYMAANADLAARLHVVKPPFNVNVYSEHVAAAAIRDVAWMDGVVADTIAERERMASMLKRRGFRVYASDANFLLCDAPGGDASGLADVLRNRRILARTFPKVAGLEHCIRFTVGTSEHTDRLEETLLAITEGRP